MNRRSSLQRLSLATLLAFSEWARCEVFLTEEKALAALGGGKKLTASPVTLTPEQKKAIASASDVRVRSLDLKVWRADNGDCVILDNVVGKHEFIDFAVAISKEGKVTGVEIMTYRESYGGEVRNAKWRAQFSGKTVSSAVKIDDDIKNIAGATLSSVHITDGVRRLLHTWSLVLKPSS
jgi:Na+-transporting NADH:ubiquinone oxidoreductase subunit NqrC